MKGTEKQIAWAEDLKVKADEREPQRPRQGKHRDVEQGN